MTKDRALRVLDVYASVNGSGQCTQDEFEEAKKMAIEALESQDRQVIIAGSYLLEGEDNVPDTNVGDIISRQAAIEVASGYCHPANIAKELANLPSAQQWIPCSERLPENEDIYMVTFDKSNLLDNETQVSDAYWINNQWQYSVLESYERRMPKLVVEPIEELKVIAWMPLPPSFEEE